MTRLSESPPAYSELDALIANLTTLDLAASTGNPRPPCSPRTPPPNRPVDSPQPTPQTPRRPATSVYEFESPTRSGCTTQWRVSTHLFMRSLLTIWMTQVRGLLLLTRVVAKTPWVPKAARKKNRAFVVFFGRAPDVYHSWYGPTGAEIQVKHVSHAVFQGYSSLKEAQAAFAYARERSWIGVRDSRSPSPTGPPLRAIPTIPLPLASDTTPHNPLHSAKASAPKWHVVYAGITPGIYSSFLECYLNTTGLRTASYQSAASRLEAIQLWCTAEAAGTIRVITPSYSVHLE
ncbi:hypothetical protein B0H13DRAFT_1899467 [Mycena leptocephala]|nr:hypothetical protein B0H13DRAFT_1899467 [Mycena leptocephala]